MNITLTFIWGSVAFLIFTWSCYYFIWPPLVSAIRTRQQTIAEGLEKAEAAERDFDQAQQKAEEIKREARREAQTILDQARAQASNIVETAKTEAREEGERLKAAGVAEVEQEANRIRETLRTDVASLAVEGAEKILGSSIDRNQHEELLQRLASEL